MIQPSPATDDSTSSSATPFIGVPSQAWTQSLPLQDDDVVIEIALLRVSRSRKWALRMCSVLSLGLTSLFMEWLPIRLRNKVLRIRLSSRDVERLHEGVLRSHSKANDTRLGSSDAASFETSCTSFGISQSSGGGQSSTRPLCATTKISFVGIGPENGFEDLSARRAHCEATGHQLVLVQIQTSWNTWENVPLMFQPLPSPCFLGPEPLGDGESGNDHLADSNEHGIPSFPFIRDVGYLYFRYRSQKFFYDALQGRFVDFASTTPDLANIQMGSSDKAAHLKSLTYGKNTTVIPQLSTLGLLRYEIIHPFFVFQIFSIILWTLDEYYFYAACILGLSVFSTVAALVETKKQQQRIRDLATFECNVSVLRGPSSWIVSSSKDLVPGDVVDVSGLQEVPCDILLAAGGDCIVNESMLTGESTAVFKAPPPADVDLSTFVANVDLRRTQLPVSIARHVLFGGTQLVSVRKRNVGGHWRTANTVIGICLRTGFRTTRGALIRCMLYPKPHQMNFHRDSIRFIFFLACLALLGFIYSVFTFISHGAGIGVVTLRALDLLTIIIPPALPATLTIGSGFAVRRLVCLYEIYCTSPQRINICGKVNLVCFDKTGTLTDDGLQIHGIQPSKCITTTTTEERFVPTTEDFKHATPTGDLYKCIQACHNIKRLGNRLVGDPLDVRMFEYTGWHLEDEGDSISGGGDCLAKVRAPDGQVLEVLWRFEFFSWLMRASTIVRDSAEPPGSPKSMMIYTKGAPEVIRSLCVVETIPPGYDDWLEFYTRHGYRVIACAGKPYSDASAPTGHPEDLRRIERADVERNLSFYGFVIFENKIKGDSMPAIRKLSAAKIGCKVCTGDNIRTAISVGKGVGIIQNQSEKVFLSTLRDGTIRKASVETTDKGNACDRLARPCGFRQRLVFIAEDEPEVHLDMSSMSPIHTMRPPYHRPSSSRPTAPDMGSNNSLPCARVRQGQQACLAVTGPCYEFMLKHVPQHDIDRILVKAKIFARMAPDQKRDLVERYSGLGYVTCFCGDGANDCQALKAADVGLSLSEADASLSAPFTSRRYSVEAVVDLLREGRAALVTSFSCFKFMALYSFIQFSSVTLLYTFSSNLGDLQFLFIDLAMILPLAITMGRVGAYRRLVAKRPVSDLFSPKVLTSLFGQVLLQLVVQIGIVWWTRQQQYYGRAPELGDRSDSEEGGEGGFRVSYENTGIFLASCHLYIWAAVVCSVGKPYRQPLTSYRPYVLTIVVLLAATLIFTFSSAVYPVIGLLPTPLRYRIMLTAVASILYPGMAHMGEYYAFPYIARLIKKQVRAREGPLLCKKRYKRLATEAEIR